MTVTVQSAANDNTPPSVATPSATASRCRDSVQVHATDPSAITLDRGAVTATIGGTLLRFDTVNGRRGNLTDVTRSFGLNLAALVTTFPTDIMVQGYACDGATARNCAFSQAGGVPTAPRQADTASVVAGVTRPLPAGGTIADAIFNANDSELYLTNPTLSRVEIFQVANTSFVAAGIPTAGPQPWGIALWPRDTLGNYGDTIVVANSGGTELSVIDVRPGVRRLAWRQDLPNFLIEQYKMVSVGAGLCTAEIEVFDVSDRPQYLATVCRPAGGTRLRDRFDLRALLDDADDLEHVAVQWAGHAAAGEADQHAVNTDPAVRPLVLGDRDHHAGLDERYAAHRDAARAALQPDAGRAVGVRRRQRRSHHLRAGRHDVRPELGELHPRLLRRGRQRHGAVRARHGVYDQGDRSSHGAPTDRDLLHVARHDVHRAGRRRRQRPRLRDVAGRRRERLHQQHRREGLVDRHELQRRHQRRAGRLDLLPGRRVAAEGHVPGADRRARAWT